MPSKTFSTFLQWLPHSKNADELKELIDWIVASQDHVAELDDLFDRNIDDAARKYHHTTLVSLSENVLVCLMATDLPPEHRTKLLADKIAEYRKGREKFIILGIATESKIGANMINRTFSIVLCDPSK